MTDLVAAPERSYRRKFRRPPTTLIVGASIVAVIVLLAIFAPLVTSYNPTTINLLAPLQGPSAAHWLGTDQLGRDIWTRLVYGARTDLSVAFIAVLAPFSVGTVLGAFAGYLGGWLDNLIMRIADVVVAWESEAMTASGQDLQGMLASVADILQVLRDGNERASDIATSLAEVREAMRTRYQIAIAAPPLSGMRRVVRALPAGAAVLWLDETV